MYKFIRKTPYNLFALLCIIPLLFLTACGGGASDKNITFADAGWESIRFHNEVAGLILEEGYGYKTEQTSGSTSATFLGLRQGDIDVYMEVWTNNIKKIYDEAIKAGDVQKLGTNFDDNKQGLYVPTYMIKGDPERNIKPVTPDLESVSDLPKYWELFKDPTEKSKGRVVGPPTGWEVYSVLEKKMKTYGLDKNLNFFAPGSETALTTSLTKAYEEGEPWVGYYWEPTWVLGKYDMTLLKEPKYDEKVWNKNFGTEFPPVEVEVVTHKDVPNNHPEVVEFLKKYKTSSKITNDALAYMQDNDVDEEETAKWWLKENQDIWTKWVPNDVAEKVKKAL